MTHIKLSLMLALWFWYDYMFQMLYLMATPMAWLSFLMKNKEVRRRTVQEVRDRKSTRLNSSHSDRSRMPSSA